MFRIDSYGCLPELFCNRMITFGSKCFYVCKFKNRTGLKVGSMEICILFFGALFFTLELAASSFYGIGFVPKELKKESCAHWIKHSRRCPKEVPNYSSYRLIVIVFAEDFVYWSKKKENSQPLCMLKLRNLLTLRS